MNCLEAQSKMIAYIDYKLGKEEKQEFLKHICHCPDCKDEVNIYYTMIEGMRQLDENDVLSHDFSQKLDDRIEHEMNLSRKKRKLFRTSVAIIILLVISFGIFGYVNFLNMLKEQEQSDLKLAQGDYYYSDSLHDYFFRPSDEDVVLQINVTPKGPEEPSFYDKIKSYNYLQE